MNKWFFKHISPTLEKKLANLGVKRIQGFGRAVGALFWYILPSRKKLATQAILKHIGLPPREAKQQARQIAYQSFLHNGQSFAELLLAPKVNQAFMRERIAFANPEQWDNFIHYPGPVVGITAHLGAWEILSGVLGTDLGHKNPAIVVRKQRNEALFERIAGLRGATGANVWGHRDAAPKVLRLLKKNGVVAFLVDHNCNRREAIFLPFLNDIAAVNVGPAVLAVRAQAAIWPIFLLHDGENYKCFAEEPLFTASLPGTREEKTLLAAEFYTRAVEKYVRLYSEQWFWMHKRWKTRPGV